MLSRKKICTSGHTRARMVFPYSQGQHNLRGEHALLMLSFQITVVLVHHLVNPHQPKPVAARILVGQIDAARLFRILADCVYHINIELSFQNIYDKRG